MIRQELNPVTCRLGGKQINQRRFLRIMEVLLGDHHQKINEPTVMSSAKSSARITQPIRRRRCCRRPCKNMWNKLFEKSEWSSDCDNRANVSGSSLGFWAWPLAIPEDSSCRYAELIRLCIPYNQVASLDVVPDCMPRPPALFEKGRRGKKKEGSFTSIQMLHAHTHTRFYTQKVLHTHKLSHTDAFTHRRWYTHKLLHASSSVTHRRFYTQQAFTCRGCYAPQVFTHRSCYTRKPF